MRITRRRFTGDGAPPGPDVDPRDIWAGRLYARRYRWSARVGQVRGTGPTMDEAVSRLIENMHRAAGDLYQRGKRREKFERQHARRELEASQKQLVLPMGSPR